MGIVPNQINRCSDCVHPIDESGECLIAKMFEKPVNPEHGCSWRVPIKRKSVLTNGDRIRAMTDEELAKFMCLVKDKLCFGCSFSRVDECEGIPCEEARKQWLKQGVSENVRADD